MSPSFLLGKGKALTNLESMAGEFNELFTSIGNNPPKKIPPAKNTFSHYKKSPNLETLSS